MIAVARRTVRWEWIAVAWNLFVQRLGDWCLIGLVYLAVNVVCLIAMFAPFFLLIEPEGADQRVIPAFVLMGLFLLVFIVLVMTVNAGALLAAQEQLRGGKPSVAHILNVIPKLPALVGLNIIVVFLVVIGMLFCIIPGLIVGGLFFFATPLLVLGDRSITQALRESYEMVKRDLVMFVLFALVAGIITGIGANVCYVGLIASYPVGMLIITVAYYECFVGPALLPTPSANQPPPPTPPVSL
jgi:uncharacterized membrane protein